MTLNNIFLSILLLYVIFEVVYSKAIDNDNQSYVETVNFIRKNDKWICGDIECPEGTFGCKIRLRTDKDDRKVLYQSFNCFDKDHNGLLGAGDIIKLKKEKHIDIQLETYEGAISVYSVGYGLGGHENADGVVAVKDLPELKESFKKNKKLILDSNA